MKSLNLMRLLIFCFILQLFSSCSVIFSNRRDVYQNMYDIKENFTLVKLASANNKIEMLTDNGNLDTAKELNFEISQENQEIIAAVKEFYNFSSFYFIQAEDIKYLAQNDFENLMLFDSEMNPINGNFIRDLDFCVLSFDGVYDTPLWKMVDGRRVPSGGVEWYPGIAMLDRDLIQIQNPFPQLGVPKHKYKTRTHNERVERYNAELKKWYTLHSGRIQKFAK